MRVTYCFDAEVVRPDEDEPVILDGFNGNLHLAEESLADYLPTSLADAGVVGGCAYLNAITGVPRIDVVYWVPADFSATQLERLGQDTITQMEDGLGEGGFEFEHDGNLYVVWPRERTTVALEIEDDGKPAPPASQIAIAARDGDIAALTQSLRDQPNDIDRKLQGHTALQLAITYGHFEAARLLITSGAAPNETSSDGETALFCCACSNQLDDSQSHELAQLLVSAGGNAGTSREYALEIAKLRNKPQLAQLLENMDE